MNHLNDSGIKCPQAIKTKDNEYFKLLKGKPASLTSFVDGEILNRIEPNHCSELGKSMALFHNASSVLNMSRNNLMGFENFGVLIKISLGNYLLKKYRYWRNYFLMLQAISDRFSK